SGEKEGKRGRRGRWDRSNARGDAVPSAFKVDEVLSGRSVHQVRVVEVDPLPPAAAFQALVAPDVVDEDAAQGLGRRGEEVAPAVPVGGLRDVEQAEVGVKGQG